MRTVNYVAFDEAERETITRALRGYAHAIQETGRKQRVRYPASTFLSRVLVHEEAFDRTSLEELAAVLSKLIERWSAETRAEDWRAMGAPGSDEAVEGLALERALAVERAVQALRIVQRAAQIASPRPRTRSEQRTDAA